MSDSSLALSNTSASTNLEKLIWNQGNIPASILAVMAHVISPTQAIVPLLYQFKKLIHFKKNQNPSSTKHENVHVFRHTTRIYTGLFRASNVLLLKRSICLHLLKNLHGAATCCRVSGIKWHKRNDSLSPQATIQNDILLNENLWMKPSRASHQLRSNKEPPLHMSFH